MIVVAAFVLLLGLQWPLHRHCTLDGKKETKKGGEVSFFAQIICVNSINNTYRMSADKISYFCYLPIQDPTSQITHWVTSSFSVLLVIYIYKKFCGMKGSHNRHTALVYLIILLWWFAFIGATVTSFWLYLEASDTSKTYTDEKVSHYTRIYFVIDWAKSYFIQLLLLYVPYHWCKEISVLFNAGSFRNQSIKTSEFWVTTPYKGIQTKLYPFLKFYIIFRMLQLALPVLFLLYPQQSAMLSMIHLGCLLLDCIVIAISLLLGMISLKASQRLIEMLDPQQLKRMFNRYLIIFLVSSIRFVLNIIDFSRDVHQSMFKQHCPSEESQSAGLSDVIFDIAATFLAQYLLIFIITRMYTLDERPEEMCRSLIFTTAATDSGFLSEK